MWNVCAYGCQSKNILKTSVHAHRTALRQAHHSNFTSLDRIACFIQAHGANTSISSKERFQILFHTMKESLHLCDLFLNLWNVNINDLLQSSRFPGTYCMYQIPATVALSVHTSQPRCNSHGFTPWIHYTDSHYIERRIFLFAPKDD